jgi:hypothetical protein
MVVIGGYLQAVTAGNLKQHLGSRVFQQHLLIIVVVLLIWAAFRFRP